MNQFSIGNSFDVSCGKKLIKMFYTWKLRFNKLVSDNKKFNFRS